MTQKPSDLAALGDEVAALRNELDQIRQRQAGGPVSRRHLLRSLAGLGVAGVAGVAAAQPAAAADGDNLILGQENAATSTTTVTGATLVGDPLLTLLATGGTALKVDGHTDDIGIETSGFIGVRARGEFGGVAGEAIDRGIGVIAFASGPDAVAFVAESEHGPTMGAQSDDGVTLCLRPATETGPPELEYPEGSFRLDAVGDLWLCVAAGIPGTWTRLMREDTTPGRVIPITPLRVLDTRATGGRAAGAPLVPGQRKGPLKGGQSITLDLVGVGPIPATASGVVGNATVLTPSGTGFLRILPAGASVPASSFNFNKGITVANGFTSAITGAGLTARAPISSSIAYHLVIDIAAYIT